MAENETAGKNETTKGTLRILTERLGPVSGVSQFLADLESTYVSLYHLDSSLRRRRHRLHSPALFWELDLEWPLIGIWTTPESVSPEYRLVIRQVRIESPGFWEFVGALNPLQQIREYLNDRHKRRQDREYREAAEEQRLTLENELIQRQILEKDTSILGERIKILKQLGYTDEEIRQIIWTGVGKPLTQLARHQDAGLIERAE